MRGGLVAVGIVSVIVGLSWGVILPYIWPWIQSPAFSAGWIYVGCFVPVILIIVGGMVFVVGLVAKPRGQAPPPPQGV